MTKWKKLWEKFKNITTKNTNTEALLSNSSNMIDALRKRNVRK